MSIEWYLLRNGKVQGPWSSEVILKLAAEGRISERDQISKNYSGPWVNVSRVKGLKFLNPHPNSSPDVKAKSPRTVIPSLFNSKSILVVVGFLIFSMGVFVIFYKFDSPSKNPKVTSPIQNPSIYEDSPQIKGLSLGMNVDDCIVTLARLFNISTPLPIKEPDGLGGTIVKFLTPRKFMFDNPCGLIRADADGRVTEIYFDGLTADKLFNTADVQFNVFAERFSLAYKIPGFQTESLDLEGNSGIWEAYRSPNGWLVAILLSDIVYPQMSGHGLLICPARSIHLIRILRPGDLKFD